MHFFDDFSATSTVPCTRVILYQLFFYLHLVSNKGTARNNGPGALTILWLLQKHPKSVRQQTLRSTTLPAAGCQQGRTGSYQSHKAEKTHSRSEIQQKQVAKPEQGNCRKEFCSSLKVIFLLLWEVINNCF